MYISHEVPAVSRPHVVESAASGRAVAAYRAGHAAAVKAANFEYNAIRRTFGDTFARQVSAMTPEARNAAIIERTALVVDIALTRHAIEVDRTRQALRVGSSNHARHVAVA